MYTMRKIGIRRLRLNLAEELGNLPLIITKRGKSIAIIDVYSKKKVYTEKSMDKDLTNSFNPVPKPKK